MATTANPPPGAQAVDAQNGSDPFVATSQDTQRQRYSAFDNSHFSLYLNGSPAQAKRALQAHLAETTRRLQETSQLGNTLVQQRKELEEKLKEVEKEKEDNDIGPELRQKLAELEKEFNEVGRETARAFLPKSRVPSGETIEPGAGTSVFSSEGHHSPTKVSVPSRKQRNQQPSRINDIALATEISTSLLSQLKDLQAVLLEKDEALKAVNLDRSQLEIEVEGLSQRLRTLDESESRLKDVNWNLETQVREYEVQSKTAADKENRMNHTLNLVRAEKSTLEREFEELKSLYSKLNDDHVNKHKQHETEISGLRRNVSMGESERGALQRKVEELANQNSELARAVSYRLRAEDHANSDDNSQSDGADEGNTITPEHSPPPSPSKATPRHGQLESETLKHSLHHAHRMIQQLKNNIHREKTEKIELKRMLQDARDELETNRTSLNGPGSAGKRRKNDKDVFKKPVRPDRLGALRTGSHEVVMEDEDWEDQEGLQPTPSKFRSRLSDSLPGAFPHGFSSAAETSAAEDFDTANETSDAAFETANERDGTSTDAFLTGAETLDGDSSDDLTETEAGPSTGTVRKRPSGLSMQDHHDVYESTASTSGDEYDDLDIKTPVPTSGPRYRLKVRQNAFRRSTPRGSQEMFVSTPPMAKDSPASFISNSNNSTPAQGKSLFAELNALSGDSEDGSVAEGTPSRSSLLMSADSSPEAFRKSSIPRSPLQSVVLPKPVMVDSGMMTDPMPEPAAPSVSHIGTGTEPEAPKPVSSMSSIATQDTQPNLPLPPALHLSTLSTQGTTPLGVPPQQLRVSSLSAQDTVPKLAPLPSLHISTVSGHGTTPQFPPVPSLDISSVSGHGTVPQSPRVPSINMSSVSAQDTAPLLPSIPQLGISSVSGHATEPRHALLPSLDVSALSVQGTDPISPTVETRAPPSLNVSSIAHQTTEPAGADQTSRSLPSTSLHSSEISTQATDPVEPSGPTKAVQDVKTIIPLNLSSVSSQNTEPAEPAVAPLSLAVSKLSASSTEPVELPRQATSSFSGISFKTTEPVVPRPASLQLSTPSFQATKPVMPTQPPSQISVLSAQYTEPLEVPKPAASAISVCSSQSTEPVVPKPMVPQFSSVSSQATEPRDLPKLAAPQFSTLFAQATEPVEPLKQAQPQVSVISTQHTNPVEPVVPSPPNNRVSDIMILQDTQPESPTLPAFLPSPSRPSTANRVSPAELVFSDVTSRETEPNGQSRPVTAHRAVPAAALNSTSSAQTESDAFNLRGITSWDQLAAQRQLEQESAPITNKDGRVPLGALAANTVDGRSSPTKGLRVPTADEGTQTMVSAEQIDRLLLARSRPPTATIATADVEKRMTPPSSPSRRNSNDPNRTPRRPGSSGSLRSRTGTPPPLPPDHKEVIAAAALKSPSLPPTPGAMGPPTIPASAYKKRPQTPSIRTKDLNATPKTGGTTPRPRQAVRSDTRSGASSPLTRRSSLSSFTSEIDQRFSVPGGAAFGPGGIPGNTTDPRMIQAITQTMIGEYLWKYTRKAGREGHSENRHRRFFWIHPYTRTLYWSDKDPATAGKSELKAKSVAIQSVQEVPDENPLPPGLHQKSLVVTTPGRTIKFTATTSQRHETWFNALEYLLMRTDEEEPEQEKPRNEIQDEFNGGYRSSSRATGRSRASMTSYISRRTSSPHHTQVPTLRHSATSQTTPQRAMSTEPAQGSMSSRFSSILRPTSAMRGSFSSRRSRTSAQDATTYEEPTNSNMELGRDIHNYHERDSDRMDMINVRACCDGRHDVGHLHSHSMKSRHSSSNVNSRPSLIGSLSSRSHSRADSRNERISHQNEMEAANSGAGY